MLFPSLFTASVLASLATTISMTSAQTTTPQARVLIFSATREFRHDSIPTAIESMKAKGPQFKIQFDSTEDNTWFSDGRINQYDALVFLSNTGEGMSETALLHVSRDELD